jgi:7-cyano-7-deazaguanine reductase
MARDLAKGLKTLGDGKTRYSYDKPDASLLERFRNPLERDAVGVANHLMTGTVKIVCPEFTSLCPKTGQPDFATIRIEYRPMAWCVESKSLKLYLMGFRNHGCFHEMCVQRIIDDLVILLKPVWMTVEGEFTPRGGIPFWPKVHYRTNGAAGS